MRICFVVSTFPSRSQTFVTTQVLRALRDGHDVAVACRAGREDGGRVADNDAGLSPEARALLGEVRRFAWPPPPPSVLRHVSGRFRDWIVQRMANRAWRRQVASDVVVAHFGYAGAAVARAQRGWAARPRLVTIYHGRDVAVEAQRDGLARYRDLFVQGDLHLAVNVPFAEMIVAGGAPRERVRTHHLGIPVAKYHFAPAAPAEPLRLAAVARMVPKKGLHVAIEALRRLTERHPEIGCCLDIGGEGPLEAALQAQVAEAGLGERIRFLGPLSHDAALALIARSHALVLPSETAEDGDQEGIPVTLMEAMALGAVVCTTDHSGIPELVEHGRTGLLSEEGCAEGLCANLLALATGCVDAKTIARAARETVERDFDDDRQTTALFSMCRRLAGLTGNAKR